MRASLVPVLFSAPFSLKKALWPTGSEPGGWWSFRGSDLTAGTQSPVTAYQDSTGVTAANSIADPLGLWLDRRLGSSTVAGAGLHLLQSTAASRGLRAASPNSVTLDGVDDGLASPTVAAGVAGNSNMYCAILMKRNSAAKSILAFDATGPGARYFAVVDPADAVGITYAGAGTALTYAVNGVAVPGGTGTTRAQLATAIPVGQWAVLEIISADLQVQSAWVSFALANVGGWPLAAGISEIALAPLPSVATQAKVRRSLYALAGISGS